MKNQNLFVLANEKEVLCSHYGQDVTQGQF